MTTDQHRQLDNLIRQLRISGIQLKTLTVSELNNIMNEIENAEFPPLY